MSRVADTFERVTDGLTKGRPVRVVTIEGTVSVSPSAMGYWRGTPEQARAFAESVLQAAELAEQWRVVHGGEANGGKA